MADVLTFPAQPRVVRSLAGRSKPAAPFTCRAFPDGYEIIDRFGEVVSCIHGPNSTLAAKVLKLLNDDEPNPSEAVRRMLAASTDLIGGE